MLLEAILMFVLMSISAAASSGFHLIQPPSLSSAPSHTTSSRGPINRGGFLFRPPLHHRIPARRGPYSPMFRPQPLSPPALNANKDRMGGISNGNNMFDGQLESGFLPSKRLLPVTSSQHVNSTRVELSVMPKALCDFYTDSLCIESHPYPIAEMQRSFPMELPALRRLLADVQQQNAELLTDGVSVQDEALYTYEHYYGNGENNSHSYKDYGADGGFVCPSDIRYVRLRRARNPRGQWKTIVNLGDSVFTQTVRIEKCLKPFSRCSYVFNYLSSECVQIYNYQRLTAWDEKRGFHMDIFKIPVACSCHLRSSSNLRQTPVHSASPHANQGSAIATPTGTSAASNAVESQAGSNKMSDVDRKVHHKLPPSNLIRPTVVKPSRFLTQHHQLPSFRLRVSNLQAKKEQKPEGESSNRFHPQTQIGHRQSSIVDRVNYKVNPVSDYMHTWG